jgi:hypothetical protein
MRKLPFGACRRLGVDDGLAGIHPGPEVGFWSVTTCQLSSSPRLSFTAWLSFCLHPR